MTASRGLFVRQTGTAPNAVGTTPIEGRLALAGMVAEQSPGVPRNGMLFESTAQLVVPRSADMSFDIGGCNPVINRATNEGVYIMSLTGTTNVATIAAPGTGSRWDLVYVKMNDPDKGDPDNLPVVGVVQGTSSTGTPTKPYSDSRLAAGSGAYVIAEAQIFSGTTGTSGGANVTNQVWQHTAMRGAPVPVLSQADRDAMTPFAGLTVTRLDLNGRRETYNGTVWAYIGQTWSFSRGAGSDSTFTSANTGLVSGTITNAPAGTYRIEAQIGLYGSSSAVGHTFTSNGSTPTYYKRRQDLTGTPSTYFTEKADFVHPGGNLVIGCGYDVTSGTASVMSATSGETTVTATYIGG